MPGDELVRREMPPGLREQAETALRLPAAERLKRVLESPKPMALVRALPDADFYLTVREVGPQDALPALALASPSQITHLLDLEGWRKDRFDPLRFGAWVALLAEAGEATLRRFTRSADDEELILLFRGWLHVRSLDIDHEEPTRGHGLTEAGDERGFVSPDGGHLLAPERIEHAPAARRLAEVLFLDDQARYLGIVRSALFELPSEVEEEALRWRTSRLEEHGYPGLEESLAVYAEPPPATRSPGGAREGGAPLAPRTALQSLRPEVPIVPAIDRLTVDERERALAGFNALAHRVLVADGADAGSIEAHRAVIERSGSYVAIGLELRGAREPGAAAAILREVPSIDLFREGYAQAAALQRRARGLLAGQAEPLFDPPLRARLVGLVETRPLFVTVTESGTQTARDFRSIADLEEARVTLDLCEALVLVLNARRGVTAETLLAEERRPFEDLPRFSTLLLTALAWHAVRGVLRIDRLPADVASDFVRTTASRRTADPEAPMRAMTRLIDALAEESELGRREAAGLRAFGVTCLDRLAADCATLDPGMPLTPRVVGCLRLL